MRKSLKLGEITHGSSFAHDLRETAQLLRRQVTAGDLDLDGREARLSLTVDIGRNESVEVVHVAVRARVVLTARGGVCLLVVEVQQALGCEVALLNPVALEAIGTIVV